MWIQGARPGDVMQIPMTCSLANAPWQNYKACHDFLGILPLTTGSGVVTSSRQQLEIAFRYGTNMWVSFPEYLARLAEVCRDELKRDIRELKTKLLRTYLGPDVEGTLRRSLQDAWGCPVYDTYGTHEIGTGGFDCPERDGMHVMEDTLYLEIVDVDTGAPLPPGERGNMVVTVFFRNTPPIIRYNLRDLARIQPESIERPCGCGSRFRRMGHFLGRSDAMVKLRGVNVYPMACLAAIKSDARTTGEWVCVVEKKDGRDEMEVRVEVRRDAVEPRRPEGKAGSAAARRPRRQRAGRARRAGQPGRAREHRRPRGQGAPAGGPPAGLREVNGTTRKSMSSPRIFDCHSHWGTAKAHIFRTPAELARQENIWKTKGRHWAEDEMMEYMRRNNVRAILDLSFHKTLPIDEIREYHDYAFDIARRNRDVVFGHWLQFDSRRWEEARDEFKRARERGRRLHGLCHRRPDARPAGEPCVMVSFLRARDRDEHTCDDHDRVDGHRPGRKRRPRHRPR